MNEGPFTSDIKNLADKLLETKGGYSSGDLMSMFAKETSVHSVLFQNLSTPIFYDYLKVELDIYYNYSKILECQMC